MQSIYGNHIADFRCRGWKNREVANSPLSLSLPRSLPHPRYSQFQFGIDQWLETLINLQAGLKPTNNRGTTYYPRWPIYIYIYPTSKASPGRRQERFLRNGWVSTRVEGMIARLAGIGRSSITDWRRSTSFLSGDGSRYLIFYVDTYIHTIKERK